MFLDWKGKTKVDGSYVLDFLLPFSCFTVYICGNAMLPITSHKGLD